MKPLAPEELSALMDGELDPARAREVEEIIATDATARDAFARLLELDRVCRMAADGAAFEPALTLDEPARRAWSSLTVMAMVAALTWVRLAPKWMTSPAPGLLLHAAALAVLLIGLLWQVQSESRARASG